MYLLVKIIFRLRIKQFIVGNTQSEIEMHQRLNVLLIYENADDGETINLFCHGTEKRVNGVKKSSLGLEKGYEKQIALTCQGQDFLYGDSVVSIDKVQAATCRRVQEPTILREEKSNCSSGLGADGRITDGEKITLVKVGWNFKDDFEEQVEMNANLETTHNVR